MTTRLKKIFDWWISSVIVIGDDWILNTGFWVDSGSWIDGDVWID
jgi:hypothetical protein